MDAIVSECLATADAALTTAKRRLTAQIGGAAQATLTETQRQMLLTEQRKVQNALAALQAAHAEVEA